MKLADYLMALTVAVLWGGNFVAAKLGMLHFPPFYLSSLRFFLVALLLVPFVRMPKAQMPKIAQLSLTLGTLHFALVFAGMYQGMDVTTAVLATQMGVPFSCLLGMWFLNDRLGIWRSSGLLIAFIGLVIIMGAPRVTDNLPAFFLVLGGAFFWSVANIQIKKMGKVDIMPLLAWVSLLSAPQLLVLSLILEENHWSLLLTTDWVSGLSIAYSAVFSTIVAYGLWYRLLGDHPVSQVVPFSLLIPLFGVSAGMWVMGDVMSAHLLAGGVVTMIGVAIIVFRKPRVNLVARV